MAGNKLISIDSLQALYRQIKAKFATKQEIEDKVDKVEGKELSDNNFTDDYKNICDYVVPLQDDGLLMLALKGPDGKIYRLALDENLRLTLELQTSNRRVTYLIGSDGNYYYLDEDESGLYLAKYTGEETPATEDVGYVRAVSNDTGFKFTLDVVDNNVVLNLYDGAAIDPNEAKYMICNDKLCYFVIENDQVNILYEYFTLDADNLSLK